MRVSLNITTQCNLDCWYCKSHSANNPKHMSIKTLEYALRKLPYTAQVQVLGGEPTLHPEFETIVKLLKGRNFYIQTNLSRAAFDKLINLDCWMCVSVHNITDDLIGRIDSLRDRIRCLDVMANPRILNDFKALYNYCKSVNLIARLRPLMPLSSNNEFDAIDENEMLGMLLKCAKIAPPEWLDNSIDAKYKEFTVDNPHYNKPCISKNHLSVFVDGIISKCPYGEIGEVCKYEYCPLV